jgi:uncharacterized damage-inducible protein DinB
MDLATLLDKYACGGATLKSAIAGLSADVLRWHPSADAGIGLWSIQQIVLHLMDSDLIWTARMKTIIAEDNPVIVGYDESKFADRLLYDEQDAARAAEIFDLNRRQFAAVLQKLGDAVFARTGRHAEVGTITLWTSVEWMAKHVDHHLKFIELKRRYSLSPP